MDAQGGKAAPARPKFRLDLEVFQDEDGDAGGQVVLKDPVTEKYFRLSTHEYRLLALLDGTVELEEALESLKQSGRYYRSADARQIVGKAAQLGLLLGTKFGTSRFQSLMKSQFERARRRAQFSRIYFLYVPLLNPDRFLEQTLWIFKKIANRRTAMVFLGLAAGAAYLIVSGLHRMENEYLFFFNWTNLLCLWVTIAFVKLIHEFAHAYTAKSFGLHVPRMGAAFLVFFPCLYCDTTDAWQLARRSQRMAISSAGILAEGVVAVLATYVWYFTLPGVVNSLAHYLLVVSFISTVLFNANPLMRFDGYFILADALRLPNLAAKSMSYLRYLLMNRVLGISLVPNPATTPREAGIFLSYGVAAFLYRVFLCTAIVLGVYYRFNRLVGLLLAVIAAVLFLVQPLTRGVKRLYQSRKEIHLQPIAALAFGCLVAVVFTPLLIPISTRTVYPCYLASAKTQKLTIPLDTSVGSVFVRTGMSVNEGHLLFQLDPTRLELLMAKKSIERNIVRQQLQLMLLDEKEMANAGEKLIELAQLEHEIALRKKDLDLAEHGILAPFAGVVTRLDYRLQRGFQPGEGAVVGEMASPRDCEVRILVPEEEIYKVGPGDEIEFRFQPENSRLQVAKIEEIRPYSERDIKDSPFSSRLGGEIATEPTDTEHTDAPLKAQYVCSAKMNNDELLPLGATGRCAVWSRPQSILARMIHSAVQAINRESIL